MRKQEFNQEWIFSKEGSEERESVTLPHDAMLHEKRTPESPGTHAAAYFPGGKYIYEKEFIAPQEWADKKVTLEFEGVYRNSKVYVNGKEAGGRAYGYIGFFVSIESYLNFGEKNTILVTVDNSQLPNSRWYSGAGIYRPVWLYVHNKDNIALEGVKITTLSYNPARIRVDVERTAGEVQVEILQACNALTDDAAAQGATEAVVTGTIPSCSLGVELSIPDAKLWSDDAPNLYTYHVTQVVNGALTDEVTGTFGIRKVEWSPKGLFINGKETLLRGGCVHSDNGILGACSYAKSEERRIRIIKEEGYNAIRSSHNPASKAMLAACDKYGIYVMDETWDMWYGKKNKFDYANDFMEWYQEDIKSLVNRDFNYPSVIMYSIGNEVSEPREEKGVKLAKEMVDYIHSLDSNRAVTCGVNLMIINMASKGKGIYQEDGGRAGEEEAVKKANSGKKKEKASGSLFFNLMTAAVGTGMNRMANNDSADKVTSPMLDTLDIAGYNYASGRYPLEGTKHPDRIVVGSETFPQDIYKNWEMVKKYPYLIGDFMWTAWDYLGEAAIGAWNYVGVTMQKVPYPWLLADVGAIDILGRAGAQAKYAATVWGLRNKPYIGVRPVNHPGVRVSKAVWRGTNAFDSWAWKNCEGNKAEIEVYADAAMVELQLNGKSLGKKKIKECKAMFKTKYASGVRTAIAYDASGKEIGRNELTSATGNTTIRVQPEEKKIAVGNIAYVAIDMVGENDVIESNADCRLHVKVEGGELLAFGSAVPFTEDDYFKGSFRTYYGQAQVVVRANKPGTIKVIVSSKEIKSASASIEVTA